MITADPRINEVSDILEKVETQVVHIAHLDDIFWQVQAIIRDNPALASGGAFHEWLGHCYVDSVTAGIRRLCDRRRDVISLWRVFQRMIEVAPLLTRERHAALYGSDAQTLAQRSWARLVGESQQHVPKSLIAAKRSELEAALKKVSDFADQNVAHTSANPIHVETTFADVRASIAAAFGLYSWCSRVLIGKAYSSPVPTILEPWLKIFRIAWIPEGHGTPKYRSLQQILDEQKRCERSGT